MGLFTGNGSDGYAAALTPEAVQGSGPWGPAIRYWLRKKGLIAADLIRLTELGKNTVSNAVRGLETSTTTLMKIAKALKVPPEEVLVSPEWFDRNRRLEHSIETAVKRVFQEFQRESIPIAPGQEESSAAEQAAEILRRSAEQKRKKQERPEKKDPPDDTEHDLKRNRRTK